MGSLNPENPPKQELDDSGYVQEEAAVKEAPPDPTCPNLLDLSDDVLLCIFQYCQPMELKALGYTCTRLGTLVLDRTLWLTVDARSAPTSKRRMHWLLAHALSAHTTALRLSGYASEHPSSRIPAHTNCPYHPYPLKCGCVPQGKHEKTDLAIRDTKVTISYAALFRLTQLCTSLTELTLDYVIIDSRVTRISLFPKTLRKLSLRGCKCVFPEEHFLDKIYDHLIYLEDLDVSYCTWIEPSCMMPLSKLSRLVRLVMQHCPKLAEFTAYASLAARYGFKSLKILDFCGSPVGDSEVSAFGWVPTLEELYLSPAENQKFDDDLPVLAEVLPWEEEEPDYYASKYSTEQWIRDEASPAPLAGRPHHNCTSGACVIYQQSEGVPCVYHPMPQPHPERYCPFLPNMRENLTRENFGHRPGCSRITEDTLNQRNNQNGESSTRNETERNGNTPGTSRNQTGSLQNDVNGSQNVDSETKQEKEEDTNQSGERKDGSKRKYEESNDSEIKEDECCEKDKEVVAKRQKIEENVSKCDKSEYRCFINQARRSQNQAHCSQHQVSYSINQPSCSQNLAIWSQNQASCSSFKEVYPTNEDPCSTIRVSCNNGAPTIIEVDLFRNRINTTQNANNNNIVSIEVDMSRNRPSTSEMTVKIESKSADAEVSCSKVEAGCSTNEASCSKVEADCTTNEASCSKVEDGCSTNEASCSKVEAGCSTNEASCSKVEACCSTNEASCSKVKDGCSTNEDSCSKVEAGCSTNEASCSKVEADCTTNEASCSKVEDGCSTNEASRSKVEAGCSKVETDLETEVTSSEAEAKSDPKFDKSNDDLNKATSKTTNKSENAQVNIFKESISEFKRRLLSAKNKNDGEPNSPEESNCKNDDSNNDTNNSEAVNDDDSPQAKKPKLDTKLNDVKRKLDYRDPKSNDMCSDTSSNYDDDDDDDDDDDGVDAAGIRRPKRLKVKSSNWVKNPKNPKKIMSKEARKNITCQMIDNIRMRYEMLRHNHLNEQRDGNQIDIDANQASTSREYNQGPSNQPTNNNPLQPAYSPQQPADNPQQPADNPQQPADNPQLPADNPQQPADNPQLPADNPQQAADNPQQPANNPHQPAFNVLLPNNPHQPQPPRFMRLCRNPPAVVIECFRQAGVADGNRNHERQPDGQNAYEREVRQPAIILPAQEMQNAEPHNRVLYVTVGRRRHALYRAAEEYQPIVGANYPVSNFFPPTHVRYTSLISDSAIRRFGRADGENINYVQIGPRGVIVPAPDVGSRPYRSNLRVLSVRGFTNVTDSSLDHLITAAPHLRLVDFSGTGVTEQGAMQFRCARPGCEVRCQPTLD